jgi:hypothetical protein
VYGPYILPNAWNRSERYKLILGKTWQKSFVTMNIMILESFAVAQLVSVSSLWSPIFKSQSLCGTCGRWSATKALVKIMLKLFSVDRHPSWCFHCFETICAIFSWPIKQAHGVGSETPMLHFRRDPLKST